MVLTATTGINCVVTYYQNIVHRPTLEAGNHVRSIQWFSTQITVISIGFVV